MCGTLDREDMAHISTFTNSPTCARAKGVIMLGCCLIAAAGFGATFGVALHLCSCNILFLSPRQTINHNPYNGIRVGESRIPGPPPNFDPAVQHRRREQAIIALRQLGFPHAPTPQSPPTDTLLPTLQPTPTSIAADLTPNEEFYDAFFG